MSRTPGKYKIMIGRAEQWDSIILRKIDASDYDLTLGIDPSCDLQDFDAILPVTLDDYNLLRPFEALLGSVIIPSSTAVSLLDDKSAFRAWMGRNGYADCIPEALPVEAGAFPYVAKARRGASGDEVRIVDSPGEAERQREFLNRPDVFRERYLEGKSEYAAHFLIDDGKVWFQETVRHTMRHEYLVKGRRHFPVSSTFAWRKSPHASMFARILNEIGFRGVACVDYKIVNGAAKIIEINPRMGVSSLPLIDALLDSYLAALGKRKERAPMEKWLVANRRIYARRLRRWFKSA